MNKLSDAEVARLMEYFVNICSQYSNFTTMQLKTFSPDFGSIVCYGTTWTLGTIYSNSDMSWAAIEKLFEGAREKFLISK